MRAVAPGESRTEAELVLDVLPAGVGGSRADARQYFAAVLGTEDDLIAGEKPDLPVRIPSPGVVLECAGERSYQRAAGISGLGAAHAQVKPDFTVAGDRYQRAYTSARVEPGPARHLAVGPDPKRRGNLKLSCNRCRGRSDDADGADELPEEQVRHSVSPTHCHLPVTVGGQYRVERSHAAMGSVLTTLTMR